MNAWRLIAKDLRIYARDRIGLAFGIALPIALATVFGFAMGGMGGGGGAPRAKLYVEDHDGSVDSEAFVAALEEAPTLRVVRIDLEDEEAETARQRVTHQVQVDLCLAAAGYPIEQRHRKFFARADAVNGGSLLRVKRRTINGCGFFSRQRVLDKVFFCDP